MTKYIEFVADRLLSALGHSRFGSASLGVRAFWVLGGLGLEFRVWGLGGFRVEGLGLSLGFRAWGSFATNSPDS